MKDRQLATVSRLRAYRTCPRYHHLQYNELLEPVSDDEAESMRFGIAGHAGLEAWLGVLMQPDGYPDVNAAALAAATKAALVSAFGLGLDAFECERLDAIIEGYHHRWFGDTYEVLAVERQFRARLINPATGAPSKLFDQGGKVDGIVRDLRDGRTWVLEHKFTGADVSPGSAYWQRLRIDSQVSIYIDGAASLGFGDIAGCLYDVISKPDIRPLKATPEDARKYTQGKGCKLCGGKTGQRGTGVNSSETADCPACHGTGWEDAPRLYAAQRATDETPEEFGDRVRAALAEAPERYYARGAVVRFDGELVEARRDVWSTVLQIRDSQRTGNHPRNDGACAYLYGRPCPFIPLCAGEAQADDPRYRRRASAHPELTPDAAKEAAEGNDHGIDSTSDTTDHRAA